jgi:hypothetical protein
MSGMYSPGLKPPIHKEAGKTIRYVSYLIIMEDRIKIKNAD